MMTSRERDSLDRYITGNYGEDQFCNCGRDEGFPMTPRSDGKFHSDKLQLALDWSATVRRVRTQSVVRGRVWVRELDVRSGSEGLWDDPYGWTEYIVTQRLGRRRKHRIVLRVGGLGYSRLEIDGREIKPPKGMGRDDQQKVSELRFENLTSLSYHQVGHYYHIVHGPRSRCPNCGKPTEQFSGYVGETMLACTNEDCKKGYVWCEPVTDEMLR